MWKTQRQLVRRKRKNQITALVEVLVVPKCHFCYFKSLQTLRLADVREGCVIIKKHIPITNLFTCLWFNEVDRFTSRDQLSFSTVQDRIMAEVNWSVDMFMECKSSTVLSGWSTMYRRLPCYVWVFLKLLVHS
ncbi:hypothetical protein LOK49_LG04G00501 [Camellia lanceoleosa]|uniref:Uncharacterized protein n=1 Tax=Camellia lanceoleosa TaxID=1840588 RepID=A0ACC0HYL6_9ERIC|nr:hypothetical protein LOK49_LG04G00501 [Camellia lanceoleosa]